VTFIDNGVILGSATVGPDGTTSLNAAALAGGTHRLTASFGGGLSSAPNVSPELLLQWPQNGPSFSLTLPANMRQLHLSESVELSVQASGGFTGTVDLSCASGVPEGYVCEFLPNQVNVGGTSKLRIVPERTRESSMVFGFLWAVLLVGMFSAMAVEEHSTATRWLLLLAVCSLALCAACTAPAPSIDHNVVVTIRAASGSGPAAIVDSAQIQVVPPNE